MAGKIHPPGAKLPKGLVQCPACRRAVRETVPAGQLEKHRGGRECVVNAAVLRRTEAGLRALYLTYRRLLDDAGVPYEEAGTRYQPAQTMRRRGHSVVIPEDVQPGLWVHRAVAHFVYDTKEGVWAREAVSVNRAARTACLRLLLDPVTRDAYLVVRSQADALTAIRFLLDHAYARAGGRELGL